MKRLSIPVLIVVLGLFSQAGCGKKEARPPIPSPSVSQPKPAAADTATDAAPPPPPSAPAAAPVADAGPAKDDAVDPNVLQTVTYALQSYTISHGHGPKTLDELVEAKMLRAVPTPPPGKKFYYNPANLEIKLVNQ